jgi:hypothetical protein
MMKSASSEGKAPKVASSAEGGMVLLSVIGLLLLLSLLTADAATQLSWNIQTSRHWIQATRDRVAEHQWIVELYRLDLGSFAEDAASVDCHALADACVFFTQEHSSEDIWRFVVEPSGGQDADLSAAGRDGPAGISGWLRRRTDEPTKVAAVWIQGQH